MQLSKSYVARWRRWYRKRRRGSVTACLPSGNRGRPLVGFAAFKKHCSLFPMGHTVLDQLGDEVAAYRTAKGTLQFTPNRPIPRRLIKKIVSARMREIETQK